MKNPDNKIRKIKVFFMALKLLRYQEKIENT